VGKSTQEKINLVYTLLKRGIPYRNIQEELKEKFGNGVSNTTFKKIHARVMHDQSLEMRIQELEKELALFKQLYFDLIEKVKDERSPSR
jgi:hypothetical protein